MGQGCVVIYLLYAVVALHTRVLSNRIRSYTGSPRDPGARSHPNTQRTQPYCCRNFGGDLRVVDG